MKIIERKAVFFLLSAIIILSGFGSMIMNMGKEGALNYRVEFTGGTLIEAKIGQEFENETFTNIVTEVTGEESPQVQKILSNSGEKDDHRVSVTMKETDPDKVEEVINRIKTEFGITNDEISPDTKSATISSELKVNAITSIVFASLVILLYITIRFKDYRFGVSAVLALIHDVLVVLAVYAIFRVPVGNAFVAAMLTIVGYSINDTIVVFDRIRENQRIVGDNLVELVNRSIKQTFTRSINTSITTLLSIVMLYFLGVSAIKEFALPLIAGILSGTYSSIFIASPIWYMLKKREKITD
ncbi:MAG: protein translocase subunit SecF [Clostridia bacterium]|jgi:preprotein translocase SecF subunit|nr:protein translocase subunit SecF [Clostridia bacterium]